MDNFCNINYINGRRPSLTEIELLEKEEIEKKYTLINELNLITIYTGGQYIVFRKVLKEAKLNCVFCACNGCSFKDNCILEEEACIRCKSKTDYRHLSQFNWRRSAEEFIYNIINKK